MKEAVRKELDRLASAAPNGRLMPRRVIAEARKSTSPLHGEFTWDERAGFEKNLLWEARQLLSRYYVVVTRGNEQIKTRHFMALAADRQNGGGYRLITSILSDKDMRANMLADAIKELKSFHENFRAKYYGLDELSEVFDAIDRVLEATVNPPPRRPTKRKAKQAEPRAGV